MAINVTFQWTGVTRIVLTFLDRRAVDVPFVWVTRPIDAGFAYFAIPAPEQHATKAALLFFGPKNQLLQRATIGLP